MERWIASVVLVAVGCTDRGNGRAGADSAAVGCRTDVECKGDRICVHGECVDPLPSDLPGSLPADLSSPDLLPLADLMPVVDLATARDLVQLPDMAMCGPLGMPPPVVNGQMVACCDRLRLWQNFNGRTVCCISTQVNKPNLTQ